VGGGGFFWLCVFFFFFFFLGGVFFFFWGGGGGSCFWGVLFPFLFGGPATSPKREHSKAISADIDGRSTPYGQLLTENSKNRPPMPDLLVAAYETSSEPRVKFDLSDIERAGFAASSASAGR